MLSVFRCILSLICEPHSRNKWWWSPTGEVAKLRRKMLQDPRRDVRYQNSYGYMDAMRKWPVQKQYIVKSESDSSSWEIFFLFLGNHSTVIVIGSLQKYWLHHCNISDTLNSRSFDHKEQPVLIYLKFHNFLFIICICICSTSIYRWSW